MAQCPYMLATAPSMCLPTPATGGQHKGPNMPQAHGAHGGEQNHCKVSRTIAKSRKFQKCLGVATSTCMWLHVVVANDFGCIHWPVDFFLHIFNKFNKFITSCNGNGICHFQAHGPKANLLLGAVLGWDHQPKLHTLGRTQLRGQAHWQGGMLAAQRKKFP